MAVTRAVAGDNTRDSLGYYIVKERISITPLGDSLCY